eukprot:TRINITY_DN307_c0_g1_i1.p1 TRINITY_DN307_c0_g1~~TRINITY_DN307_c0_g1_i1.p1  ORF type:complete len:380 (-),score=71.97 TRINITY_DN307_c0_g1_i1:38-1177(-)
MCFCKRGNRRPPASEKYDLSLPNSYSPRIVDGTFFEKATEITNEKDAHAFCIAAVAKREEKDLRPVFVGGEFGRVVCFDWAQQRLLNGWKAHDDEVLRLCTTFNGDKLVTASRDTSVKLWNTEVIDELELLQTFNAHTMSVTAVLMFRAMGLPMIVSGGRDTKVCFWDVETGKLIREKETPRNIVTAMVCADGDLVKRPGSESDSGDTGPCIIQASEDRRFRIWDVRVKDVVQEFGETQYFQLSMDLCRSRLVTGTNGFEGEGCQVQFWDTRALEKVDEHNAHNAKVVAVKFLPYGHSDYVLSSSVDKTLRIWDMGSRKHSTSISIDTTYVNSLDVSPVPNFDEGTYIQGCCFDGTTRSWTFVAYDDIRLVAGTRKSDF